MIQLIIQILNNLLSIWVFQPEFFFNQLFLIFVDDCEKDDKNDFECEMELMQELKRHENVIQLLGVCKSMYQLHYFILRPSHSVVFLKIVFSLEQY